METPIYLPPSPIRGISLNVLQETEQCVPKAHSRTATDARVESWCEGYHLNAQREFLMRFFIKKCESMENMYLVDSGWWYTYPSEKYEFVSWDDDIPN